MSEEERNLIVFLQMGSKINVNEVKLKKEDIKILANYIDKLEKENENLKDNVLEEKIGNHNLQVLFNEKVEELADERKWNIELTDKFKKLQKENKCLKEMYEKRVNEYLELKKKVGDIE